MSFLSRADILKLTDNEFKQRQDVYATIADVAKKRADGAAEQAVSELQSIMKYTNPYNNQMVEIVEKILAVRFWNYLASDMYQFSQTECRARSNNSEEG